MEEEADRVDKNGRGDHWGDLRVLEHMRAHDGAVAVPAWSVFIHDANGYAKKNSRV